MRKLICIMFVVICVLTASILVVSAEETVNISSDFIFKSENGRYIITGYNGEGGKVIIPDGVHEIGVSAFEDNLDITEIVLPESIERIGSRAFTSCENMKKINFPDGLEYIGESSFGDTGVEKVWLPDSVEFIGDHAFSSCNCTEVRLPDGLTKLEWGVFSNCYLLETVEFPSKLEIVGDRAFFECLSANLVLPEGVSFIDCCAFDGVDSVHIPSTVTQYHELFLGPHDSYHKPSVSTPSYNSLLSLALSPYENIQITYTESSENELFFELVEIYKRKAVIDVDFCGDPELIAFDEEGKGKIFFQNKDKLVQAEINGVNNNEIFFGETDRKLYHLKDKDGRQFFAFIAYRDNEHFPAAMYILEPRYLSKSGYPNETFNCIKVGEQQLHIYDENNGTVYFTSEQTAGEHYSLEYNASTNAELYKTLHKSMQTIAEKYISGFELVAEYDLDKLFSAQNDSNNVILGSFAEDVNEYTPISTEKKHLNGKSYFINENKLILRLGRTYEKIDFDELSEFENLSVLEIIAENELSLKGIEKLENLRSLTLRTGANGFTDTEYTAKTNLQSLTLYGEFENIDFISDCDELVSLQLFPDSEKDCEYYNPIASAQKLQFVVLGRSNRNGTLNITEETAEYISERTSAYIHKCEWDKAIQKSEALNITYEDFSFEMPWLIKTHDYPEKMKIKIGNEDIIHGGNVEGVSFENGQLILENTEISTEKVAGIIVEGFDKLDIVLIGDNKIEAKHSAFRGCTEITLLGNGSLTVERNDSERGASEQITLVLKDNVKYISRGMSNEITEYKKIYIRDNAVMEADKLRCSTLSVNNYGVFNANKCIISEMYLYDSAQMNVTGNIDEAEKEAVRVFYEMLVTDNAKLSISTNRNGIGSANKCQFVLSGNAVIEISGGAESCGIELLSFEGYLDIRDYSKLIIKKTKYGVNSAKFIISGGVFECSTVENGYPVAVRTKGASYLIEGNIIKESCSDRTMEYDEENDRYVIFSDGKAVEEYSVTVESKQNDLN